MADHSELVAEMPVLEQMGTQERQKLAKKRRLQQLKKWGQREKEWIAKEKQLNKRLANMLHEENNGLNLKQYTSYSSNHRSKKKLQLGLSNSTNNTTTTNTNGNALNSNNYHNNNNNLEFLNNNISNLNPHGRVRFNVGVMLLEAAARNDFDEVKRLLSLGVSPDSINHDGLTALHQCCIDASEPMMNLLLEYGANVDAKDTEQWTPLHAACTCGHLNLVKILVAHDANLLAVNGDGNMPFDICEDKATSEFIESQMHKRGITQEMIDFTRASTEMQLISDLERQLAEGGDLDAADSNGVTQLHIASANGYLMAVQFLLKNNVNVNVCDNDLWRPIHGAACWGNQQHAEVIELLVEAGAVLDAKTINDETVFDLCDNPELLERLNQLKDELESKQATGTDRLRRTQSRTNSRVHSVRRTSVRDKNQISRRDAREEALLRVENSPQPIVANSVPLEGGATTNGQQTLPATSTSTLQQQLNGSSSSNGSNDVMADKSSENEKLSYEELSKSSLNSTTDALLPINGSQQVERKQQRHNRHHLNKQSGVDDGDHDKQHIVMLDSVTDRSQSLLSTSSSNNLDTVDHHQHHQVSSKESATKSKSNNNNNSDHSLPINQHQRLVESKSETILTGSASTLASKATSSANTNTTALHSQLRKANAASCDDDIRSNNDIACDPSLKKHQQQQQQQQQQVVSLSMTPQLAPMNFTLSNLKKQRSEVRMRTTSIGGGIVIVNASTNNNATNSSTSNTVTGNGINGTSVSSNGASYQVLLDPKPSSLLTTGNGNGNGNGAGGQVLHQRPESPSLTFRKFSGEPSELIGSRRGSRHECCILI